MVFPLQRMNELFDQLGSALPRQFRPQRSSGRLTRVDVLESAISFIQESRHSTEGFPLSTPMAVDAPPAPFWHAFGGARGDRNTGIPGSRMDSTPQSPRPWACAAEHPTRDVLPAARTSVLSRISHEGNFAPESFQQRVLPHHQAWRQPMWRAPQHAADASLDDHVRNAAEEGETQLRRERSVPETDTNALYLPRLHEDPQASGYLPSERSTALHQGCESHSVMINAMSQTGGAQPASELAAWVFWLPLPLR